jgi:large-conductance mechanosensitive channel
MDEFLSFIILAAIIFGVITFAQGCESNNRESKAKCWVETQREECWK